MSRSKSDKLVMSPHSLHKTLCAMLVVLTVSCDYIVLNNNTRSRIFGKFVNYRI